MTPEDEAREAVTAAVQLQAALRKTHAYLTAENEQIIMNAALHLLAKAVLDGRSEDWRRNGSERAIVDHFVWRARTAQMQQEGW